MHKICNIDIEHSEKVFKKIEKYKQRVIKKLNPKAIILFGSFTRNDINEGSDVDIVVIADFKEKFLDRIKILLDLNTGLPLEPIGYTPDEFNEMRINGNSFILKIIEESKLLYGDICFEK